MTLTTFCNFFCWNRARVVFSLFVNHTFREPKYYEILGLPTVQYKHFIYYSTNKSWSDDDLVSKQFFFVFSLWTISSPHSSPHLTIHIVKTVDLN